MICVPAAARLAFRVGVWGGTAESAARTAQMITSLKRASKVFELLEGGAAERKPGRRKLNVFARWAISGRVNLEDAVSEVFWRVNPISTRFE
jgi:hypothetical protein